MEQWQESEEKKSYLVVYIGLDRLPDPGSADQKVWASGNWARTPRVGEGKREEKQKFKSSKSGETVTG